MDLAQNVEMVTIPVTYAIQAISKIPYLISVLNALQAVPLVYQIR